MTILSTDIKLRESERMTDTSDGGGRRTNNLIVDGVAGNIFPKVSRLDSVYGRVNFRKVYGHVDTANIDTYAGAHLIITDAPDNDRIHVTAFSTANDYDNRTAARDRVESYVIAGPVSRMTLYGRQLLGSQAILAYQRVEEPLPEIGTVYAVSTEVGNVTSAQQFFNVQAIDHEERVFNDGQDFTRRVVTLTLGTPLRYEFNGPASPVRGSSAGATGVLRTTTVADASRYFGIKPLTDAVAVNDMAVNVASVYTPIVPSTQREAPLSLAVVNGANYNVSLGAVRTVDTFAAWDTTRTVSLGGAIKPGSLTAIFYDISQPAGYRSEFVDNGVGGLVGGAPGDVIDYENGVVTYVNRFNGYFPQIRARFIFEPVVAVAQPAHTQSIDITLGTRGTVYSIPLLPIPAAGTLIVDYRALGKWYRLRDDGNGVLLGGSAAYGTGTVDYISGGVIVTLGALPDVGSSIILSWGSPVHYQSKINDASTKARLRLTLPDLPVKRGVSVFTYYVNGVATTASADAQGVITGTNSVTGTLRHLTGEVTLEFGAKLPDAGSIVSVSYTQLVPTVPGETLGVSGTFPARTPSTLAYAPFVAGSLQVSVTLSVQLNVAGALVTLEQVVPLADNGAGSLSVPAGTVFTALTGNKFTVTSAITVGTINYTTGAVAISGDPVSISGAVYRPDYSAPYGPGREPGWVDSTALAGVMVAPATYSAELTSVATSDSAKTHSVGLDVTPLTLDLLVSTARDAVPGSIIFTLAGLMYFDRNGTLYANLLDGTGEYTLLTAGTINYDTGVASLLHWKDNTTITVSVQTCLTLYGDYTAVSAFFRTAGSPLRLASLYIQVNAADGDLLTGTTDQNGVITGTAMLGLVDQTIGVVAIRFGAMVTAAGNELEDWYDADDIVMGQIWKPRVVLPGTLRYSAVILSNLPLNADVLGLDPVRLPSDGRVPIYRPADVCVIHHTGSYNAGTPAASAVLNVGRTGLSALWLEDADRKKLAAGMYSANLPAGTVTMAADLSLTGYTPPIAAKHRIEEMVLLSDVQINGTLSTTAPVTQAYPLGSFVSSALLFGDLFARVTGVFDQGTWTSVWSDTLLGSAATGQYNDVDHPIEVLNGTANTDRWRISFTSATVFQVVSENMGVIAVTPGVYTGSTAADIGPVNPLTGQPYFVIRAAGWGTGWATGNQLRFNTIGASPPMWLARTVLPGATLSGDSFDAQLRGDVD